MGRVPAAAHHRRGDRYRCHPELGIRRRLAVAVRSGERQLGAHLGAGRPGAAVRALGAGAAGCSPSRRTSPGTPPPGALGSDPALTRTLLAGLLEGSTGPQPLANHLGLDASRPAAVLGFTYGTAEVVAAPELTHTELTNLISVHIAARHRSALVTQADSRLYVLLPQLPRSIDTATLRGWGQEVIDAARRHLGLPLRGSVGCLVSGLGNVPESRREGDRILDAMPSADVSTSVAALPDIEVEVLVSEMLTLLSAHPEIRDPRLTALLAHDNRHQGQLAESLLAYLNSFGDVRDAATQLHVHPNTLRYRLRRAEELTGLDLSRPDQRLLAMLQLQAATRFLTWLCCRLLHHHLVWLRFGRLDSHRGRLWPRAQTPRPMTALAIPRAPRRRSSAPTSTG